MKKLFVLFLTITLTLFGSDILLAQSKAKIEITSITQKDETVTISFNSSKPFIFGNNRYILHIGDKEFSRYDQAKKNGKGSISFFVSASDFDNLADGIKMYLSYGRVNETQDMESLAQQSPRCWALGMLNKNLLSR